MATLISRRADGRRSATVALLLVVCGLGVTAVGQRPAEAAVSSVKGYACGYYTNVGLFGGPQSKLGCEPQISRHVSAPATASSLSPSVSLPPGGSAVPITATDADGAAGKYGPATIFGGIWPDDVASPTPSGPIRVSTQGTTGVGGSVTSSTDIELHAVPKPVPCYLDPSKTCLDPGGFGPPPVWGDDLHVECSANETSVTGSTTFTNSWIARATDSDGAPLVSATEPIPTNPPVNYTRSGVITNVGDVFTAVFNEQIVNSDGSLTVNAVHMYLFGPTAVGDMVKGQVTCGTTPTTVSPNDTVAPFCGYPVVAPLSPENPTPKDPREELVGVFDAGGIQSVSNVQVTNGTVRVGMLPNNDADPNNDYLKFTPGQTGPLTLVAVRTNQSQPMTWSFDVTDMAGNTSHCKGAMGSGDPVSDFDGNATSDVAVYRPSNGTWFVRGGTSVVWGASGDIPVPGDYDGNGVVDVAVYRPSTGTWFVRGGESVVWGISGDIPVPGDYDGDGKTDIAVYRPSNGTWYVRNGLSVVWGAGDDIPVPGDYDADGKTDIAVYRPGSGTWFVRNVITVIWGAAGDIPVPGDYDGSGTTDIAVYRPSTGTWFVRNGLSVVWGIANDIPMPADYDGNGSTDVAVYRPSSGTWYVRNGLSTVWGAANDIPLSLPYALRLRAGLSA